MGGVILVVDDEPSIREAFELVLGSSFKLHLACSVEEALTIPPAAAAVVKIIFLDDHLGGGLSGAQSLPLLRRQFPKAYIVFIGALGSLDTPGLRAAGASAVLPKPWKVTDILAAARTHA